MFLKICMKKRRTPQDSIIQVRESPSQWGPLDSKRTSQHLGNALRSLHSDIPSRSPPICSHGLSLLQSPLQVFLEVPKSISYVFPNKLTSLHMTWFLLGPQVPAVALAGILGDIGPVVLGVREELCRPPSVWFSSPGTQAPPPWAPSPYLPSLAPAPKCSPWGKHMQIKAWESSSDLTESQFGLKSFPWEHNSEMRTKSTKCQLPYNLLWR